MTKYLLGIETDGKHSKVSLAKELVKVNQFRRTWKRINARDLARKLNHSQLVIK